MFQHYKGPVDGYAASWVGRAWIPGPHGGPAMVAIRPDGIFNISQSVATMSALLDLPDPASFVREAKGERIGSVEDLLQNSDAEAQ
ncbi:MAG: hypothetical protein JOY71_14130, partial [Acetobacteraceae bacterium]|nr:hypothetical protein [Acetobacteraceae bacterium]